MKARLRDRLLHVEDASSVLGFTCFGVLLFTCSL